MIAQIFILTAKLLIVTGTQTNEANIKIETQLKTVEIKINYHQSFLIQKQDLLFLAYSSLKHLHIVLSFFLQSLGEKKLV